MVLKKYLRQFLATMMIVFSIFSVSNQAQATTQSNLKVMIGSVKGKSGQLVTVPVSIENVKEGIGSYNIQLDFHSDELEVVQITPVYGDNQDNCDQKEQGCLYFNYDNAEGWIRTLWLDSSGNKPLASEKQLFMVTFKIKSTSVGAKAITIDQSKDSNLLFSDENIEKIPLTITNGEVLVESDSSSAGGGNSNSEGSNPNSGGTIRQGAVDFDNGNTADLAAKIDIVRQIQNNKKTDQVFLDNKTTEDAVKKALELKQELINIRIPDIPSDPAEEVSVKIPKLSIGQLSDNHVSLNIQTDDVGIRLPKESIQGLDSKNNDLFFRVVPIWKEDEKQQVFENTKKAQVVQKIAGNQEVQVLGKPMTIETNYQNQKTFVTFSLKDIKLPNDSVERDTFLKHLAVFIQHSDGEKVVQKGKIKYDSKGKSVGIEIEISKFSTFSIIELPNSAPVASNVSVSGKVVVGETIKGKYSYKDLENDQQGKSIFNWYRANNAKGTNKHKIAGATKATYTITSKDQGKYISFEVTPVAKKGTLKGVKEASNFIGPVKAANTAPNATNLKITGKLEVNSKLKATYRYKDVDKDMQGKSIIKWYRIDPKTNKISVISGATKATYKVTSKDEGKKLMFEVKPIAKTGMKSGKVVYSKKTSIIKAKYQYSLN